MVIALGTAVALAIGARGLFNLKVESDHHAAVRAGLFASVMAARLSPLPMNERLDALQRAARKTGAEMVLVAGGGEVLLDASLGGIGAAAGL